MNINEILCDVLLPLIDAVLSLINPFLAMLGIAPISITCEDLFPPVV